MTVFVPSTLVTVMRGVTTDEFGDEIDADVVVASGLPALVTEDGQQTGRPADGRDGGVAEQYVIRLRPDADVVELDRLLDQRTTAVYQVTAVYTPQGPTGIADVRVTAVRISSTSLPVNG